MPMTRKRYRCRTCGALVDAWLPWAQAPFGVLLLEHLSHAHPDQLRVVLATIMNTDELGAIVAPGGADAVGSPQVVALSDRGDNTTVSRCVPTISR